MILLYLASRSSGPLKGALVKPGFIVEWGEAKGDGLDPQNELEGALIIPVYRSPAFWLWPWPVGGKRELAFCRGDGLGSERWSIWLKSLAAELPSWVHEEGVPKLFCSSKQEAIGFQPLRKNRNPHTPQEGWRRQVGPVMDL